MYAQFSSACMCIMESGGIAVARQQLKVYGNLYSSASSSEWRIGCGETQLYAEWSGCQGNRMALSAQVLFLLIGMDAVWLPQQPDCPAWCCNSPERKESKESKAPITQAGD